jgi:hypothetical protein
VEQTHAINLTREETANLLQFHHLLYKYEHLVNTYSQTAEFVIREHMRIFIPNRTKLIISLFKMLKSGIIPAMINDLKDYAYFLLIKNDDYVVNSKKYSNVYEYLEAVLPGLNALNVIRTASNKKISLNEEEKEYLDEFKKSHLFETYEDAFDDLLTTTFAFSIWRTLVNLTNNNVNKEELHIFDTLGEFALLFGVLKEENKVKILIEFFPFFSTNEFFEMIEDVL